MTSFVLKLIAMCSMFIDHLGDCLFSSFSPLNYVGRIAFPIFAFQISEGYLHTRDLKRYFIRLGIFALVSQAPFMLFLSIFSKDVMSLNIFFTLILGLLAIFIYDKIKYKSLGLLSAIILCFIGNLLRVDYGYYGVAIIFIFYLFKDKKIFMNSLFILLTIIKFLPNIINSNYYYPYILLTLFTILPIVFINLYNGKQGRKTNYLLYLFYPVHLGLLYVLHLFL